MPVDLTDMLSAVHSDWGVTVTVQMYTQTAIDTATLARSSTKVEVTTTATRGRATSVPIYTDGGGHDRVSEWTYTVKASAFSTMPKPGDHIVESNPDIAYRIVGVERIANDSAIALTVRAKDTQQV